MKASFKSIFKGKVVIAGIGNTMRGDDGLGPAVIKALNRSLASAGVNGGKRPVCIDCGGAPENYLGKIVKENPDTVLIVDAVDLGSAPGEYKLLTRPDILNCGLTTHDISANLLIDFLEKQISADIYLLGIQPETLSFADELSESAKKALAEISQSIQEAINA